MVYRQEKGKYSELPWIKQQGGQGGQKVADMIKVYQAYSPKIKSAGMLEMHKVIEYIAGRSGLNAGK